MIPPNRCQVNLSTNNFNSKCLYYIRIYTVCNPCRNQTYMHRKHSTITSVYSTKEIQLNLKGCLKLYEVTQEDLVYLTSSRKCLFLGKKIENQELYEKTLNFDSKNTFFERQSSN